MEVVEEISIMAITATMAILAIPPAQQHLGLDATLVSRSR
jgi:hypothetical protein